MSKDNSEIVISEETQRLVKNILVQIAQLEQRRNELLTVVFNESGKKGDYQPNERFTALELIKEKSNE